MLEYYNEITYYLLRLTGDKHIAKDLTQETYVKVLEASKKSDIKMQKAFLYKIAHNLLVDKVRKDKILTQTTYEEEDHFTADKDRPEEILTDELRQQKLKQCIGDLSPRNKKAFVLHYYKGYTRKEIGIMMDISTNAVEKNITRAVLKIKEQMEKDY